MLTRRGSPETARQSRSPSRHEGCGCVGGRPPRGPCGKGGYGRALCGPAAKSRGILALGRFGKGALPDASPNPRCRGSLPVHHGGPGSSGGSSHHRRARRVWSPGPPSKSWDPSNHGSPRGRRGANHSSSCGPRCGESWSSQMLPSSWVRPSRGRRGHRICLSSTPERRTDTVRHGASSGSMQDGQATES